VSANSLSATGSTDDPTDGSADTSAGIIAEDDGSTGDGDSSSEDTSYDYGAVSSDATGRPPDDGGDAGGADAAW
jgi:hypothetical protein